MFKNNKIYNQELITKSENLTFKKINSFTIMQKAANACSKFILSNYKPKKVIILCGPGNNGGDGILIANNLIKKKYKSIDFCTNWLCKKQRFKKSI